jgi:hypothetical protein
MVSAVRGLAGMWDIADSFVVVRYHAIIDVGSRSAHREVHLRFLTRPM